MVADEIELKKWKNRIWHPEIECSGKKNREWEALYDRDSFYTCSFKSLEVLYQFLDYGIRFGKIRNNFVQFIRGDVFDIYISTNYSYIDKAYDRIIEFLSDQASQCKGKWIVCDALNTDFDYQLAGYLCAKLKVYGCRGLLYYFDESSGTVNNFEYCTTGKNICDNVIIGENGNVQ